MLDRVVRPFIAPALESLSKPLLRRGFSANQVTWAGFGFGLLAMASIAGGHFLLGLALLLVNRLADGLDGCLARARGESDLGAYLDIVLDFIVYSGIVFAFALAMPDAALPAAFLIYSFVGTGSSFLAFAIFAAKRGLRQDQNGRKGFFYLGGLAEGTETILFFAIVCVFPQSFSAAAGIFGVLCWLTTLGRVAASVATFKN